MSSKSKAQQKFMGMVYGLKKGEISPSDVSTKVKKAAGSMSKSDAEDFASTKHKGKPEHVKKETMVRELIRKLVRELMEEMDINEGFAGALKKEERKAFDKMRREQSQVLGYTLTGTDDVKTEIDDATIKEIKIPFSSSHIKQLKRAFKDMKGTLPDNNPLVQQIVTLLKKTDKKVLKQIASADIKYLSDKAKKILGEAKKRDYKAEYKKFQSSTKSKKYRAELNAYNRKKGTYGNGDGKDASHKGGKIVGFESESKNRGRAEKSRLKKEGKLTEDFKNNEWEVYVADENRREKIVKVAKSKRAAVILYNKLIKTDKYHEVGMRVIKEGKLTEGISVADTRFVGKFVIHILSSGNEMRSAILSKKNNSKYGTRDKKDLKTLWDLAGKYKGKEIKEGKLNEGSKVVTLPNGIKVKIDFKGLTFIGGTKPVFLDRREMEIFFKATARYLK